MNTIKVLGVFGILCVVSVTACSKRDAPPTPVTVEPVKADEAPAVDPAVEAAYTAKTLFNSKCVVCHGGTGKGDGPGAAALNPKSRAFEEAGWQTAVTDEQIQNTIVMGGPAVGKSPAMPANPDLGAKPEVVKELVKIVRAFKKG